LIIFRAYLTFVEAIILLLKHATYFRLSNLSPESALTQAELHYQEANVDSKIQQHLAASSQEHSVEIFAAFVMATDIGWLFLSSARNLRKMTHQVHVESTHMHPDLSVPSQSSVETPVHQKDRWFKQFLDPLRKTTRKNK
jgi:hypothetical protein